MAAGSPISARGAAPCAHTSEGEGGWRTSQNRGRSGSTSSNCSRQEGLQGACNALGSMHGRADTWGSRAAAARAECMCVGEDALRRDCVAEQARGGRVCRRAPIPRKIAVPFVPLLPRDATLIALDIRGAICGGGHALRRLALVRPAARGRSRASERLRRRVVGARARGREGGREGKKIGTTQEAVGAGEEKSGEWSAHGDMATWTWRGRAAHAWST